MDWDIGMGWDDGMEVEKKILEPAVITEKLSSGSGKNVIDQLNIQFDIYLDVYIIGCDEMYKTNLH